MRKSETIANLATALSGFQGEVATIGTDKKNPFFKNEYATLGQLIEDTKALRAKYQLSIAQMPEGEGGLVTMLMHSSGEWIEATSTIRLEAEKANSLAQSAGKLITYQRRYAYAAILGLVSDKDADGNISKEPAPEAPAPVAPPVKPTAEQKREAFIENVLHAIKPRNSSEYRHAIASLLVDGHFSNDQIKGWVASFNEAPTQAEYDKIFNTLKNSEA